jgi:glycerol kinase
VLVAKYVAAIDQGTSSTRFIVFDHQGQVIAAHQREHRQIYPSPGWVEHDPLEIWENTQSVIDTVMKSEWSPGESLSPGNLAAIGVTNQRETTVVWDRRSGTPYYNALVWQDTRTDQICQGLAGQAGVDRFRDRVGLPLATYFSGPKLLWLLDNIEGLRREALSGNALFGTIDSWLLWNLTGGPQGGIHITDVTNASRTMLMNLSTLEWDEGILEIMNIPIQMLPEIRPSSQPYGNLDLSGSHVPLASDLGDQQAALFGQTCFRPGEAKNTYGTGCFMLLNTGQEIVPSEHGLLTTVAYQIGGDDAIYALEGSIAITGALVQWLRDNLGIIENADQVETLAASVEDNGGIYFVPAFSGLFAPHWRSDARGVIAGLTRYVTRAHIARAALEATAFQTREVLDAMRIDDSLELPALKVDGGMVGNELLMQFQADILGVPVVRPKTVETTALGAAYAAGLAVGFWEDQESLRSNWAMDKQWLPSMSKEERERHYQLWKKAVDRTLGWIDDST